MRLESFLTATISRRVLTHAQFIEKWGLKLQQHNKKAMEMVILLVPDHVILLVPDQPVKITATQQKKWDFRPHGFSLTKTWCSQ